MLATKLRALRRAADLTQAVLAARAGLTERTIRNLETGGGNVASLSAALAPLGYRLDPLPASPRQHVSTLDGVRIVKSTCQGTDTTVVATAPATPATKLKVAPCTLLEANAVVARLHRHHKPAQGHRFSLKAIDADGNVHGAAIVGRPIARRTCQSSVVEVTRLVTNGTPNACSILLGAAARTAKEMGFAKIQTFTLATESGTSLKASGWRLDGATQGGDWNVPSRGGRRVDQPMGPKTRWARDFG